MNDCIAPLQLIESPWLAKRGVKLHVLRLDQLDNGSGNKWFKLKYNIAEAKQRGYQSVLSFGGAFSNHIHALALAARDAGLDSVGIIRGDASTGLNDTLRDAERAGMQLKFVSRDEYRRRNDADYLQQLPLEFSNSYIIPEGGSNLLGVKGCMEIVGHIYYHLGNSYDVVTLPCGTAATMAGIVAGVDGKSNESECTKNNKDEDADKKTVLGFSVLKNAFSLDDLVEHFLASLDVTASANWTINHDCHGGGYAKVNADLINFIDEFESQHNIPLEPVYSGKAFYGLYEMIKQGFIKKTRIVAIHTGGLQGLRGMKDTMHKYRNNTSIDPI